MIVKFVTLGSAIAREVHIDAFLSRSIQVAKRVPRPVRAIFDREQPRVGPVEVTWDTQKRQAELVPFYERSGW